jgi:hypothetical protein
MTPAILTTPATQARVLSGAASARWRKADKRVALVWGALFVNVLAYAEMPTVLPIPGRVGQLVTQGGLLVGLGLALMLNTRGVMRPNAFMLILTIAAVVAVMTSIHSMFVVGSTYRSVRYLGFLLVAWLLTPWWGRRDMLLLRCHRLCLALVLGSVVLGAVLSPGAALGSGRLSGVVWPVPPPQVAHYAATMFGTTVLLWMCKVLSGRHASLLVLGAAVVLVATHTRTALIGLFAGLLVGGASLFLTNARVRRTAITSAALGLLVMAAFANELRTWALRGQDSTQVAELTGRTKVWSAVMSQHRTTLEHWFGSGMSNMSFDGLPIDSNWVATYQDQGWFGVGLEAVLFLFLLVVAIAHVRGPHKAIALFLVVYCIFASITEAGLDGPSPYMLDLMVAASLLGTTEAVGRT